MGIPAEKELMEYADYEKLRKRIHEFTTFDETNYSDRLRRIVNFRSNIINLWQDLKLELEDKLVDIDELRSKTFDKLKKQTNLYENKYEIEMVLDGDAALVKLRREANKLTIMIEGLEHHLKSLSDMSFNIKALMGYEKFQSGES